ncbi:metalloregulator ArsR/SmtB family transcription factor [Nocardioides sp. 503]|uniref:ArsR/SmtB family transcription factor n=1 Tax=Nocardioides sp. 503 TaxID=2508326 RepID=UPI0010704118|nr:metalloregulator ArsR/SmtB family transcription factor [Nocardioides sp. 503]
MDVFAALADPVRRELLRALAAGPARVVDLASAHPISRPAVSRHLLVLAEAGLVAAEDRGRERHYRLRAQALAPVSRLVSELVPAPPVADAVLDGLDLEVRRTGRERRSAAAGSTRSPARTPTEETA